MKAIEREVKLAAGHGFVMPSFDGLLDGITAEPSEPERLWTTYYDTDDLRLARWGLSVRHRSGYGWTVKLPTLETGPVLARPEITVSGNGAEPPPEILDLVRAVVRSGELRTRTQLDTLRRRIALHDAQGSLVADVFDDDVAVLEARRPLATFREVEVEVHETTPSGLLEELVGALRKAGAGEPDPTPKYIRSLEATGATGATNREIQVPDLTSRATCGDVVRRALAASAVRLIEHDSVMRLGTDPEGVHQARVATRRLRSDLRTFASLLEPTFASDLRDELGWLADILGRARDCDVLLERIRRSAARLPEASGTGAAEVLAGLDAAREAVRAELLATLRSDRYVQLLDRLVEAANAPELLPEADRRARAVLPGLVRRPWRSLEKRVRTLGRAPTNAGLHDVRIRTKRLRYAAEAAAPVVGKRARALAAAAAALQEVLGDLNDAVVAEGRLREWSRGASPEGAFVAGKLAEREQDAARRSRLRWRKAWKELSAPKLSSWM
ncbi:MAG TPA: CYTH and CHAD domain-containing protein [Gaiellaceae bacterium]|nr:CYTH and CHAD domain-containing protein [Gaiellaceae bacterium]